MPKLTKAWVASLDQRTLDRILALGMHNRRAMLPFVETDKWFHICTDTRRRRRSKSSDFWDFFIPYYTMWVSMTYVVHEGLVELGIEDGKLEKLRTQANMSTLRKFRNATFHFQSRFRDQRHGDLITRRDSLDVERRLWERQDFLVRKMNRFVRYNPLASEPIL